MNLKQQQPHWDRSLDLIDDAAERLQRRKDGYALTIGGRLCFFRELLLHVPKSHRVKVLDRLSGDPNHEGLLDALEGLLEVLDAEAQSRRPADVAARVVLITERAAVAYDRIRPLLTESVSRGNVVAFPGAGLKRRQRT